MPDRTTAGLMAGRTDTAKSGTNAANVTTSDTTPIAANVDRIALYITNDSDTTVYLAFGTTAVASQGIRLNSTGGAACITEYTGAIHAIHAGVGNKVLTWVEV